MRIDFNSYSSISRSIAPLVILLAAGWVGLGRNSTGVLRQPPQSVRANTSVSKREARVETRFVPDNRADRWGDGFPDGARLDRSVDAENFVRWVTFLAEAQYYQPAATAQDEIDDCAGLVRFAYRNALVAHTPLWWHSLGLPFDPGFDDVRKFAYPEWPLGRGLFRVRPGPFDTADVRRGAFSEFADSATLLHHNSFFVSRNIRAARPGDLLFFHQPGARQPYHSMIYIGRSYFQPQGAEWIVYHTGELNGGRGEIREVEATLLTRHPDPRWRPLEANPRFLGIYRFEILR